MAKQVRDDSGKFTKKVKILKKPKNPDCEPATKGYVKCIARKGICSSVHRHEESNSLSMILGIFSTIMFILAMFAGYPSDHAKWGPVIIIFAIIGISCALSLILDNNTEYVRLASPDEIKEYEPPTCTEKNECE